MAMLPAVWTPLPQPPARALPLGPSPSLPQALIPPHALQPILSPFCSCLLPSLLPVLSLVHPFQSSTHWGGGGGVGSFLGDLFLFFIWKAVYQLSRNHIRRRFQDADIPVSPRHASWSPRQGASPAGRANEVSVLSPLETSPRLLRTDGVGAQRTAGEATLNSSVNPSGGSSCEEGSSNSFAEWCDDTLNTATLDKTGDCSRLAGSDGALDLSQESSAWHGKNPRAWHSLDSSPADNRCDLGHEHGDSVPGEYADDPGAGPAARLKALLPNWPRHSRSVSQQLGETIAESRRLTDIGRLSLASADGSVGRGEGGGGNGAISAAAGASSAPVHKGHRQKDSFQGGQRRHPGRARQGAPATKGVSLLHNDCVGADLALPPSPGNCESFRAEVGGDLGVSGDGRRGLSTGEGTAGHEGAALERLTAGVPALKFSSSTVSECEEPDEDEMEPMPADADEQCLDDTMVTAVLQEAHLGPVKPGLLENFPTADAALRSEVRVPFRSQALRSPEEGASPWDVESSAEAGDEPSSLSSSRSHDAVTEACPPTGSPAAEEVRVYCRVSEAAAVSSAGRLLDGDEAKDGPLLDRLFEVPEFVHSATAFDGDCALGKEAEEEEEACPPVTSAKPPHRRSSSEPPAKLLGLSSRRPSMIPRTASHGGQGHRRHTYTGAEAGASRIPRPQQGSTTAWSDRDEALVDGWGDNGSSRAGEPSPHPSPLLLGVSEPPTSVQRGGEDPQLHSASPSTEEISGEHSRPAVTSAGRSVTSPGRNPPPSLDTAADLSCSVEPSLEGTASSPAAAVAASPGTTSLIAPEDLTSFGGRLQDVERSLLLSIDRSDHSSKLLAELEGQMLVSSAALPADGGSDIAAGGAKDGESVPPPGEQAPPWTSRDGHTSNNSPAAGKQEAQLHGSEVSTTAVSQRTDFSHGSAPQPDTPGDSPADRGETDGSCERYSDNRPSPSCSAADAPMSSDSSPAASSDSLRSHTGVLVASTSLVASSGSSGGHAGGNPPLSSPPSSLANTNPSDLAAPLEDRRVLPASAPSGDQQDLPALDLPLPGAPTDAERGSPSPAGSAPGETPDGSAILWHRSPAFRAGSSPSASPSSLGSPSPLPLRVDPQSFQNVTVPRSDGQSAAGEVGSKILQTPAPPDPAKFSVPERRPHDGTPPPPGATPPDTPGGSAVQWYRSPAFRSGSATSSSPGSQSPLPQRVEADSYPELAHGVTVYRSPRLASVSVAGSRCAGGVPSPLLIASTPTDPPGGKAIQWHRSPAFRSGSATSSSLGSPWPPPLGLEADRIPELPQDGAALASTTVSEPSIPGVTPVSTRGLRHGSGVPSLGSTPMTTPRGSAVLWRRSPAFRSGSTSSSLESPSPLPQRVEPDMIHPLAQTGTALALNSGPTAVRPSLDPVSTPPHLESGSGLTSPLGSLPSETPGGSAIHWHCSPAFRSGSAASSLGSPSPLPVRVEADRIPKPEQRAASDAVGTSEISSSSPGRQGMTETHKPAFEVHSSSPVSSSSKADSLAGTTTAEEGTVQQSPGFSQQLGAREAAVPPSLSDPSVGSSPPKRLHYAVELLQWAEATEYNGGWGQAAPLRGEAVPDLPSAPPPNLPAVRPTPGEGTGLSSRHDRDISSGPEPMQHSVPGVQAGQLQNASSSTHPFSLPQQQQVTSEIPGGEARGEVWEASETGETDSLGLLLAAALHDEEGSVSCPPLASSNSHPTETDSLPLDPEIHKPPVSRDGSADRTHGVGRASNAHRAALEAASASPLPEPHAQTAFPATDENVITPLPAAEYGDRQDHGQESVIGSDGTASSSGAVAVPESHVEAEAEHLTRGINTRSQGDRHGPSQHRLGPLAPERVCSRSNSAQFSPLGVSEARRDFSHQASPLTPVDPQAIPSPDYASAPPSTSTAGRAGSGVLISAALGEASKPDSCSQILTLPAGLDLELREPSKGLPPPPDNRPQTVHASACAVAVPPKPEPLDAAVDTGLPDASPTGGSVGAGVDLPYQQSLPRDGERGADILSASRPGGAAAAMDEGLAPPSGPLLTLEDGTPIGVDAAGQEMPLPADVGVSASAPRERDGRRALSTQTAHTGGLLLDTTMTCDSGIQTQSQRNFRPDLSFETAQHSYAGAEPGGHQPVVDCRVHERLLQPPGADKPLAATVSDSGACRDGQRSMPTQTTSPHVHPAECPLTGSPNIDVGSQAGHLPARPVGSARLRATDSGVGSHAAPHGEGPQQPNNSPLPDGPLEEPVPLESPQAGIAATARTTPAGLPTHSRHTGRAAMQSLNAPPDNGVFRSTGVTAEVETGVPQPTSTRSGKDCSAQVSGVPDAEAGSPAGSTEAVGTGSQVGLSASTAEMHDAAVGSAIIHSSGTVMEAAGLAPPPYPTGGAVRGCDAASGPGHVAGDPCAVAPVTASLAMAGGYRESSPCEQTAEPLDAAEDDSVQEEQAARRVTESAALAAPAHTPGIHEETTTTLPLGGTHEAPEPPSAPEVAGISGGSTGSSHNEHGAAVAADDSSVSPPGRHSGEGKATQTRHPATVRQTVVSVEGSAPISPLSLPEASGEPAAAAAAAPRATAAPASSTQQLLIGSGAEAPSRPAQDSSTAIAGAGEGDPRLSALAMPAPPAGLPSELDTTAVAVAAAAPRATDAPAPAAQQLLIGSLAEAPSQLEQDSSTGTAGAGGGDLRLSAMAKPAPSPGLPSELDTTAGSVAEVPRPTTAPAPAIHQLLIGSLAETSSRLQQDSSAGTAGAGGGAGGGDLRLSAVAKPAPPQGLPSELDTTVAVAAAAPRATDAPAFATQQLLIGSSAEASSRLQQDSSAGTAGAGGGDLRLSAVAKPAPPPGLPSDMDTTAVPVAAAAPRATEAPASATQQLVIGSLAEASSRLQQDSSAGTAGAGGGDLRLSAMATSAPPPGLPSELDTTAVAVAAEAPRPTTAPARATQKLVIGSLAEASSRLQQDSSIGTAGAGGGDLRLSAVAKPAPPPGLPSDMDTTAVPVAAAAPRATEAPASATQQLVIGSLAEASSRLQQDSSAGTAGAEGGAGGGDLRLSAVATPAPPAGLPSELDTTAVAVAAAAPRAIEAPAPATQQLLIGSLAEAPSRLQQGSSAGTAGARGGGLRLSALAMPAPPQGLPSELDTTAVAVAAEAPRPTTAPAPATQQLLIGSLAEAPSRLQQDSSTGTAGAGGGAGGGDLRLSAVATPAPPPGLPSELDTTAVAVAAEAPRATDAPAFAAQQLLIGSLAEAPSRLQQDSSAGTAGAGGGDLRLSAMAKPAPPQGLPSEPDTAAVGLQSAVSTQAGGGCVDAGPRATPHPPNPIPDVPLGMASETAIPEPGATSTHQLSGLPPVPSPRTEAVPLAPRSAGVSLTADGSPTDRGFSPACPAQSGEDGGPEASPSLPTRGPSYLSHRVDDLDVSDMGPETALSGSHVKCAEPFQNCRGMEDSADSQSRSSASSQRRSSQANDPPDIAMTAATAADCAPSPPVLPSGPDHAGCNLGDGPLCVTAVADHNQIGGVPAGDQDLLRSGPSFRGSPEGRTVDRYGLSAASRDVPASGSDGLQVEPSPAGKTEGSEAIDSSSPPEALLAHSQPLSGWHGDGNAGQPAFLGQGQQQAAAPTQARPSTPTSVNSDRQDTPQPDPAASSPCQHAPLLAVQRSHPAEGKSASLSTCEDDTSDWLRPARIDSEGEMAPPPITAPPPAPPLAGTSSSGPDEGVGHLGQGKTTAADDYYRSVRQPAVCHLHPEDGSTASDTSTTVEEPDRPSAVEPSPQPEAPGFPLLEVATASSEARGGRASGPAPPLAEGQPPSPASTGSGESGSHVLGHCDQGAVIDVTGQGSAEPDRDTAGGTGPNPPSVPPALYGGQLKGQPTSRQQQAWERREERQQQGEGIATQMHLSSPGQSQPELGDASEGSASQERPTVSAAEILLSEKPSKAVGPGTPGRPDPAEAGTMATGNDPHVPPALSWRQPPQDEGTESDADFPSAGASCGVTAAAADSVRAVFSPSSGDFQGTGSAPGLTGRPTGVLPGAASHHIASGQLPAVAVSTGVSVSLQHIPAADDTEAAGDGSAPQPFPVSRESYKPGSSPPEVEPAGPLPPASKVAVSTGMHLSATAGNLQDGLPSVTASCVDRPPAADFPGVLSASPVRPVLSSAMAGEQIPEPFEGSRSPPEPPAAEELSAPLLSAASPKAACSELPPQLPTVGPELPAPCAPSPPPNRPMESVPYTESPTDDSEAMFHPAVSPQCTPEEPMNPLPSAGPGATLLSPPAAFPPQGIPATEALPVLPQQLADRSADPRLPAAPRAHPESYVPAALPPAPQGRHGAIPAQSPTDSPVGAAPARGPSSGTQLEQKTGGLAEPPSAPAVATLSVGAQTPRVFFPPESAPGAMASSHGLAAESPAPLWSALDHIGGPTPAEIPADPPMAASVPVPFPDSSPQGMAHGLLESNAAVTPSPIAVPTNTGQAFCPPEFTPGAEVSSPGLAADFPAPHLSLPLDPAGAPGQYEESPAPASLVGPMPTDFPEMTPEQMAAGLREQPVAPTAARAAFPSQSPPVGGTPSPAASPHGVTVEFPVPLSAAPDSFQASPLGPADALADSLLRASRHAPSPSMPAEQLPEGLCEPSAAAAAAAAPHTVPTQTPRAFLPEEPEDHLEASHQRTGDGSVDVHMPAPPVMASSVTPLLHMARWVPESSPATPPAHSEAVCQTPRAFLPAPVPEVGAAAPEHSSGYVLEALAGPSYAPTAVSPAGVTALQLAEAPEPSTASRPGSHQVAAGHRAPLPPTAALDETNPCLLAQERQAGAAPPLAVNRHDSSQSPSLGPSADASTVLLGTLPEDRLAPTWATVSSSPQQAAVPMAEDSPPAADGRLLSWSRTAAAPADGERGQKRPAMAACRGELQHLHHSLGSKETVALHASTDSTTTVEDGHQGVAGEQQTSAGHVYADNPGSESLMATPPVLKSSANKVRLSLSLSLSLSLCLSLSLSLSLSAFPSSFISCSSVPTC